MNEELKNYVGCKIIRAIPIPRGLFDEREGKDLSLAVNPDEEGYMVIYSDEYKSWSPKDVFDSAYLPLGSEKMSITGGMVDRFIRKAEPNARLLLIHGINSWLV